MGLNTSYRQLCTSLEKKSAFWKKVHQRVWTTVALLTLSNLLMAVLLLGWRDAGAGWHTLADWAAPLFSGTVGALTLVQLTVGPKGRWLGYRAAVQKLWKECMHYRAHLPPYDSAGADEQFRSLLEEIGQQAADSHPSSPTDRLRHAVVRARDRFRLPQPPQDNFGHLPDDGPEPRLADLDHADETYIAGRLRSQEQWYLKKARENRTRYLIFQVGIILLTSASSLCVMVWGRQFWMVASTATVLVLVAWRDFLDSYSLWFQYGFAAGQLRDIERAYRGLQPPFDTECTTIRFRQLVAGVEAELFREFESWQAVQLGWRAPLRETSLLSQEESAESSGCDPTGSHTP